MLNSLIDVQKMEANPVVSLSQVPESEAKTKITP